MVAEGAEEWKGDEEFLLWDCGVDGFGMVEAVEKALGELVDKIGWISV